jgi:hypothetical protein
MNIYFPQVGAALVARKTHPKDGKFVTGLGGGVSVYVIPAEKCPRGCRVAEKCLGGWNFPTGECVSLVYARTLSALFRFRREEAGDWLVKPRQIKNGLFCGLIMTRTKVFMSIGVTPDMVE